MPAISRSDAQVSPAALDGLSAYIRARGMALGSAPRVADAALPSSAASEPLDLPGYCALIERVARKTGDDAFGLRFGRDCALEWLGPVGEIALSSPSLGVALDNLVRFLPYHQQNTEAAFSRGADRCRLEYRIRDGRVLERRQDAELTITSLLQVIRQCVGARWAPSEVHFEHPRPAGDRVHRSILGAPLYFSMGTNALVFCDPDLSRPMPGRDAVRLRELCAALGRVRGGTGTLSLPDQVAGEIRSRLASGYPHIEEVSDALRMTRWSLQRRLAEHGHVFSELVETTRRRLAELHLGTSHMPIRDVADELGYSELSAFSRACVRWFGQPPSRVRATIMRQRSEPPRK